MSNNKVVFRISIGVTLVFIIFGIFMREKLDQLTKQFLNATIDYFGWFYLLAALSFLLFSVYLAYSKYGKIKLGKDSDQPIYSRGSWLAMLFSAGMGIGLLFWGVAEPVFHYMTPPFGDGNTADSANLAMRYAFFHWGLQPWAIYSVVALSLAYFQYRRNMPALISSAFYPLLGSRTQGFIGKTIDILAVFATVFGVATSLGLGTMQIAGGLNFLWNVPNSASIHILIIVMITAVFLLSAYTGLDRGIKFLSNVNVLLAFILMFSLLILGPTSQIFKVLISTTGSYINNFFYMSLRLEPFREDTWIASWTLFYWAWWIAWAPFVGTFIARISKGRTIKEFIVGVLLVPTLGTFVWFSTFGGSALHLIHDLGNASLAEKVAADVTSALFSFYEYFPMSSILSILTVILVITFFVTSADSATFVLGMLSEEGNLNPSNKIKIIWGSIIAAVSIVLLLSKSLTALQTASIGAAFPFAIVMVFLSYSLLKALQNEQTQADFLQRESERNVNQQFLPEQQEKTI